MSFFYTGDIQSVSLPPGVYYLECWGADGGLGNYNSGQVLQSQIEGGTGGYSKGTILVPVVTTFYIVVGGKGDDGFQNVTAPGGYNGGGDGSIATAHRGGGGGGATHIATKSGLLNTLESFKSDVKIVAGAGGGGGNQSIGGNGGGLNGVQPDNATQFTNRVAGAGGTQVAPGTCFSLGSGAGFGQGGTTTQNLAGGGGSGWYGGCTGDNSTGGGGGSGYIGGVTNGITVHSAENAFIANPVADGNGFVRIVPSFSGEEECLDYSVGMLSVNSPEATSTIAGVATPVHVTIINRGLSDLDSCYLNWSLNGVTQSTGIVYRHASGLASDFVDTLTLG
jgi:hypothetical protein